MMNIPWSGVLVGTNESLKRYISKDSEHTFFSYFCIAAVSSAFASLMTIPLDNIKTRL